MLFYNLHCNIAEGPDPTRPMVTLAKVTRGSQQSYPVGRFVIPLHTVAQPAVPILPIHSQSHQHHTALGKRVRLEVWELLGAAGNKYV